MTTNGMLLNDRNCERIVRGQLAHLFCSIDSNDPEVYANMRVGGELRRVEDGLRRLAQWKQRLGTEFPKMTCNATFLERNIRQLPSMVAWAKDLGFQELSVQLMEIENPELEEEFLGHHAQLVHDSVLEALAVGRRIGMSVRPHLAIRNLVTAARAGRDVRHHEYAAAAPNMPADRKRRAAIDGKGSHGGGDGGCQDCPLAVDEEARQLEELLDMSGKTLVEKCHYPWYNLLIDTDGDARPCCWADLSFVNLNDVPFDQMWNGPRAVGMRQAFLANRVPHSCRRKHCRVDL